MPWGARATGGGGWPAARLAVAVRAAAAVTVGPTRSSASRTHEKCHHLLLERNFPFATEGDGIFFSLGVRLDCKKFAIVTL
jgi:hypothetical protein